MQNPLANIIGVFFLVRDDRGLQVNPLCRHDITRSDRQIGNHGSPPWELELHPLGVATGNALSVTGEYIISFFVFTDWFV